MRKLQTTKKPTLHLATETLRRLDDKTLVTIVGGAEPTTTHQTKQAVCAGTTATC